jgi:anti-sigma B factor antagonist
MTEWSELPDAGGRRLVRDIRERLEHANASTAPGLVLHVWDAWDDRVATALVGEMDMGNASEFRRAIESRLESGSIRLVVDMSQLTFIDSSGIRELTVVAKRVREAGGEMVLVAPTREVSRVLEFLKLDAILRITPSLEAALVSDRRRMIG